jgi:hypothetical protein
MGFSRGAGVKDVPGLGFFLQPCFVTVAHVLLKGFPAKVGNLVGSGTEISERGWSAGLQAGIGSCLLRVVIGGSENQT